MIAPAAARWRGGAGRLAADARGGVNLLIALGMPVLLGVSAVAVDLGSATLETRKLQGVADAAALAAASDPSRAQALAEASVAAARWPRPVQVIVTTGTYSRGNSPATRFTAAAPAPDAVRVRLETPSPTFFARAFGQSSVALARQAVAARTRLASFSVGSRLASVNGGVLNGLLSGLTGSNVSLSVMDYNALAGADVDLLGMLGALRTTANLQAGTYEDVLKTQVTRQQLLGAIAATLDSTQASAAAALRTLGAQLPGGTIRLADLVDPGVIGQQSTGGTGLIRLNVLQLVTGALQLGGGARQVSVDLGATLPGLASTKLVVAIGERPAHTPLIAVTDNGEPVLHTAQTRIYLEVQLANVGLPGIGTLVAIKLPIFIELASARARLGSIDCATGSPSVTIQAAPSPGQAAIAALDASKLQDFSTPIALSTATLVDTLLVDVDGRAQVDLGAAEQWRSLRFDNAMIAAGTAQTVSSNTLTQGISASLVSRLSLSVRLIGLPIPLTPLVQAVGAQLALVTPALDGLLSTLTGALGIGIGEADVRVTGVRCNQPALVG